jgi:transposase-like protein
METGNASLVARKHNIISSTVTRWIRELKLFSKTNNPLNIDYSPNFSLGKENEQLKKLLGEKNPEIEILKDLLKNNQNRRKNNYHH